MASTNGIIVWVWEDDRMMWQPYSPHVSNYIEQQRATSNQINLHNVDYKMRHYALDLKRMKQMQTRTGTLRAIDRHIYGSDTALYKQFVWQYEGDVPGTFQPYDKAFADILEQAFENKTKTVDFQQSLGMPYKVDLNKMVQIRIETKKKRKIQRVPVSDPVQYLPATAADLGLSAASGTGTSLFGATASGAYVFGSSTVPNSSALPKQPVGGPTPATATAPSGGGAAGLMSAVQNGLISAVSGVFPGSAPTKSGQGGKIKSKSKSLYSKSTTAQSQLPKSTGALSRHSTVGHATGKSSGLPLQPAGASSLVRGAVGGASTAKSIVAPYGVIPNMPDPAATSGTKKKSKKNKDSADSHFDEIIEPVSSVVDNPPDDDDCCVCMNGLREDSGYVPGKRTGVIQLKCKHMLHKPCLKAMYDSGHKDGCIQCPTCKAIFGTKRGNCPYGTMTHDVISSSLPGHEDCDTIRITYDIQPGIQGPEHPQPGQRYGTQGFPRIGFLPNSRDGQKVLKLLIKAWERRLTFTIGQSVTTGAQNMVVWNNIHHKTEIIDRSGHGYPAPGFLHNVTAECKALGIIASDTEDSDDSNTHPTADSDSDDSDL